MQYAVAALALAAAVHAAPAPQAASGCQTTYPGSFEITVVNTTDSATKRSLEARQAKPVTITLTNGELKDDLGRLGYIASNNQFQFDNNGQAGAKITSGWAVCPGGLLTLGGESVFTQCLSGGFYNLYTTNDAAQCNPIHIYVLGASSGGAPAQQSPDGQPVATQIGDGQVQAPVTQIGDGQVQAPTGAPVTQIGDGQVQAPTGAPVTQIGDGQIQAPTGAPVTQIGDGQIQAPTGAPVTQIGDGQVQAPAVTGSPVTQIGDGQVQAPAVTGAPVTQIGDGQVQAPTNGSVASPTPVPYTGSAVSVRGSVFGLFAGILAVALL